MSKSLFASRSILALPLLVSLLSLTGVVDVRAADSASVRPAGVTKTAAGQTTHTHYPLTEKELEKVRFAKGVLAPKGHLYYPTELPKNIHLKKAIIKGIKNTCDNMLSPFFIVGVKAIERVSKHIPFWVKRYGIQKTNHYLA